MVLAPTLKQQLTDNLTAAMKARKQEEVIVIRGILTEIKYKEISVKGPLTPEQELAVLTTERKKLAEALEAAITADRPNLIEKGETELAIIDTYMPRQLTEEEFLVSAENAIITAKVTKEVKNMGKVMKILSPEIKGRFDGKRASLIVKNLLDPNVQIINPKD